MDMSQGMSAAAPDEGKPVSQMDKEALFLTLQRQVRSDLEHSAKWRVNATDEFAFVAGTSQWTPEEVQALNDQARPVVTFNKTLKFVKALCGIETNNRREITYLPRDVTDEGEVAANELLTTGSEWMAEGCDAGREQSRGFRDAVICGMGWTEGTIEFDCDPRGGYVETRCDPLEMFWDRNARAANLKDSKRRGRIRRMTLEEARNLIPGVTDADGIQASDLDARWAAGYQSREAFPKTQEQKELREESTLDYGDSTDVYVVQVQWWEYETYYRTVDLSDPSLTKTADLSKDEFDKLQAKIGVPLPKAELRRKKYLEAIIGGKVLWAGDCKRKDGFTLNCITWEPDDIAGTWFGIVRVLRDPQQWANKFFSQLMHMVNSTAKGGILAEEDAFADMRQAQKTYARTNHITVTAKGALQNGKIQPKPGAAITGGVAALLQIADAAFGETSGINLELLGLVDRDQAGILEAQRKQAAMTILATLFDGYTGFHKDVGGMRLYFLQNYLADDRLIRVKGEDGYKALPLLKDQMLGRYDVIVDDAPSSPNAKEQAWSALQPVMPLIMQSQEAIAVVLDYIPNVPQKLIAAFKKILTAPNPAAQQAQQLELQSNEAQIEKDKASAKQSIANAALALARAGTEQAKQATAQLDAVMSVLGTKPARPGIPENEEIMGSTNTDWTPRQAMPMPAPADVIPPQPAAQPNGVIAPGGI